MDKPRPLDYLVVFVLSAAIAGAVSSAVTFAVLLVAGALM